MRGKFARGLLAMLALPQSATSHHDPDTFASRRQRGRAVSLGQQASIALTSKIS
jgi:hypothetical protein